MAGYSSTKTTEERDDLPVKEGNDSGRVITSKDITRKGKRFTLPDDVPIEKCLEVLQKKVDEEQGRIEITEIIEAFPWDGVRAFQLALKELHGVSYHEKVVVNSFFGPVEYLPELRSIEVDYGVNEFVPWGQFAVPGIDGDITTKVIEKNGFMCFGMVAKVLTCHEKQIREIADLTRKFVKEKSIYRGKAFSVRFLDEDDDPIKLPEPKFMDVNSVDLAGLIYTRNVEHAIDVNLWTPIRRTEECRQHGIPLKRGVLLYGKYGTGKTLGAYATAKLCRENNWTFIYIYNGDELPDAIKLAHHYQPAVIFCEDIDSVMRGERTCDMNDVLNAIDGIENKGSELITVLTSNHVGEIHKAMLRPGRIDAAIEVSPPDSEAAERLIRYYAGPSLAADADLKPAADELDGEIPAVISEAVEKAKLGALYETTPGGELRITSTSLLQAAFTMRAQRGLLHEETAPNYSPQEKAVAMFINGVAQILKDYRNGGQG